MSTGFPVGGSFLVIPVETQAKPPAAGTRNRRIGRTTPRMLYGTLKVTTTFFTPSTAGFELYQVLT